MGHAAVDLDPHVGNFGELDRVVLTRPDRLGEVLADLLGVDVEGGDELDVANVVAAEIDVHQAGDARIGIGVLVVLDALDEGVGAVADADDRDADLAVVEPVFADGAASVRGAHRSWCLQVRSRARRDRRASGTVKSYPLSGFRQIALRRFGSADGTGPNSAGQRD